MGRWHEQPGHVRSIGNAPGKTFIVSGNHTYASPGNYQIETFVTDVGGSRTVAFSEAIVTRAPLALPLFKLPFPLKAVEGLVFPGIVPLVIFVGSPGSVVGDFNAQIQFGDGGSAQGKIEDAGSDTSGEDYYVFAPAHTYDEEGTYTITVTITLTSTGQSVSEDQPIDVDDAPLTVIGATDDLPEGITGTQVVGTFTDANPMAPLSDFTAEVEPDSSLMDVSDVSISQPGGTGTPFIVNADIEGDDDDLGNLEEDGSGFLLTVSDVGGSVGTALASSTGSTRCSLTPGSKSRRSRDPRSRAKSPRSPRPTRGRRPPTSRPLSTGATASLQRPRSPRIQRADFLFWVTTPTHSPGRSASAPRSATTRVTQWPTPPQPPWRCRSPRMGWRSPRSPGSGSPAR